MDDTAFRYVPLALLGLTRLELICGENYQDISEYTMHSFVRNLAVYPDVCLNFQTLPGPYRHYDEDDDGDDGDCSGGSQCT